MNNRIEQELRQEKESIRRFFNSKRKGFFIEVGANEPCTDGSQSHHLERDLEWSGILIEPIAEFFENIEKLRPRSKTYTVACTAPEKTGTATLHIPVGEHGDHLGHASLGMEANPATGTFRSIEVKAVTLNEILGREQVGPIDFLSIDVEDAELDVLRGTDLRRYRPSLILMEDHLTSLDKHRHLRRNGYQLVNRTGHNSWYCPRENAAPLMRFSARLKLFKKMYLSVWIRKFKAARQRRGAQ